MEWKISDNLIEYPEAIEFMEQRVNDIKNGNADECIWLLEHPHLYTAGTSADDKDLLDTKLPVFKAGRGGQYTYHGPGQRIAYVMMDLKQRQSVPDVKKYIYDLEEWIIRSLSHLDIKGERREGRVGIWVDHGNGEESKIAAIGVRIRHWITFHGISINVNPDLSNFSGIVPCGISDHGVTSIESIKKSSDMKTLDQVLINEYQNIF